MDCLIPPPLTEEQLFAIIDDVDLPDVRDHLGRCGGCTARLAEIQRFEQALRKWLYRWDCPPAHELGEYHLGLLAATDSQAVALHVQGCMVCRAELTELDGFLEREPLAPLILDRPPGAVPAPRQRERIARVRTSSGVVLPALRGAAGQTISADVGDLTILLNVEPADDGQIRLIGQLLADDLEAWVGALAELRRDGAPLAVTTIDDVGGFGCGPLAPGVAELRVVAPGGVIVVPDLMLAAP